MDDEAIELIEQHHRHIRFDWPRIIRGEAEPTSEPLGQSDPPPPADDARGSSDLRIDDQPISAARAALGPDVLARLRTRFANLTAAIARRVPDPEQQARLKAEADRLNPDNWTTSEEVRQGLDQYETVFESFRGIVGRRRRRRKPQDAVGPESDVGPMSSGPEAAEPPDNELDDETEPEDPGPGSQD